MPSVKIITDSSAYLPQKYVDQYGITSPAAITDLGWEKLPGWGRYPGHRVLHAPGQCHYPVDHQPGDGGYFKEAYQKLLDEGHEILVLPLSRGISGSYYSALQALS